jgi:hypothetical protein
MKSLEGRRAAEGRSHENGSSVQVSDYPHDCWRLGTSSRFRWRAEALSATTHTEEEGSRAVCLGQIGISRRVAHNAMCRSLLNSKGISS